MSNVTGVMDRQSSATAPDEQTGGPATREERPQWRAAFELELPHAAMCTIHPGTYDVISQTLGATAPAFHVGRERLGISFRVPAANLRDAQTHANEALRKVLALLKLDDTATSVMVSPSSQNPPTPEPPDELSVQFVGVGEAAEILGVTKQRIHQLTKTIAFPKPLFRLRATPVWRQVDIERFQEERERQARA